MTKDQLDKYKVITSEFDEWWGHEDGYTWEEGSDFFEHITEKLFDLLDEIAKEDA